MSSTLVSACSLKTLLWNNVTMRWNKLAWNDLTMARSDRIPSNQSNESLKYRSVINFLPNTAKYALLYFFFYYFSSLQDS